MMDDALNDIQSRDPNGGTREPTEADYRAHEEWAVAKYGRDTWNRYQRAGNEESDRYRPYEEYEGLTGADSLSDYYD